MSFSAPSDAAACVEFFSSPCFADVVPPLSTLSDLNDGLSLSAIMNAVHPSSFDSHSLAHNVQSNWPLKLSNVKKLRNNLLDYYASSLNLDASAALNALDLTSLCRDSDEDACVRLCDFVVGALISCPSKATYITAIMELDAGCQVALKGCIERAMTAVEALGGSSSSSSSASDRDRRGSSFDDGQGEQTLTFAVEEEDSTSPKLWAENEQLKAQNEILKLQLSDLQSSHQSLSSAAGAALHLDETLSHNAKLSGLVSDLQERLDRESAESESRRSELRSIRGHADAQASKLETSEAEKRALLDEVDVLRSKAVDLAKAEATIDKMKKKMDEVPALQRSLKDLEDKSAKYLDQIMDLEEKAKQIQPLTKKVDLLKERINQQEKERLDTEAALDAKAADISRLKNELSSARSTARMFEDEVATLKVSLAAGSSSSSFSASSSSSSSTPMSPGSEGGSGIAAAGAGLHDLKERVQRLERENRELRAAAAAGPSPPSPGFGDLGDAADLARSNAESRRMLREEQARCAEISADLAAAQQALARVETNAATKAGEAGLKLAAVEREKQAATDKAAAAAERVQAAERETKEAKDRAAEAEREARDARERAASAESAVGTAAVGASDKVNKLLEANNKYLEQIAAHSGAMARAEKDLREGQDKAKETEAELTSVKGSNTEAISKLAAAIKNKEATIDKLTLEKTKLETYTKQTLHKFQDKYLIALQQCKQKLKDKHEKIESLEKRIAMDKAAQKREERLLSSSIYEMGLFVMKKHITNPGSSD